MTLDDSKLDVARRLDSKLDEEEREFLNELRTQWTLGGYQQGMEDLIALQRRTSGDEILTDEELPDLARLANMTQVVMDALAPYNLSIPESMGVLALVAIAVAEMPLSRPEISLVKRALEILGARAIKIHKKEAKGDS
jgi:hypothetical protein